MNGPPAAAPETATEQAARPRLVLLLGLAAALLITALAYRPGLAGPLLFDDFVNLTSITQYLEGSRSATAVIFGNISGPLGRPVAMASFLADAALFGQDIRAAKRTNLLIHLLNAVLLALLLRLLATQHPSLRMTPLVVLALTAFWVLQPMSASTVLYLVQRMTLLSATFVLLGLMLFVHVRAHLAPRRLQPQLLLWLGVPACTVLAMLCKENGVLLPLLAVVVHVALPLPDATPYQTVQLRRFFLVVLLLPLLLGVGLMLYLPEPFFGLYALRDFGPVERMLTQGRVLWSYVASTLLPYTPSLSLFHDGYAVSRSLIDPLSTLFSWLAWAVLLALVWRLRQRAPGLLLGLGLFLAGHALESSILPLEIYFEHRNYLPSAGLFIAVYALLLLLADTLRLGEGPLRALAPMLVAAALLVSAGTLAVRASIWSSEESLFAHELKHNASSVRIRSTLIARAIQNGQPELAMVHIRHLESSTEGRLAATLALWKIIVSCTEGSSSTTAQREFEGHTGLTFRLYDHIAIRLIEQKAGAGQCPGLDPLALATVVDDWLQRSSAATSRPEIWATRLSAARLAASAGQLETAASMARQAWQASAGKPGPGAFLLQLLLALGRPEEAREIYLALQQQAGQGDHVLDEMLRHYAPLWDGSGKPALQQH